MIAKSAKTSNYKALQIEMDMLTCLGGTKKKTFCKVKLISKKKHSSLYVVTCRSAKQSKITVITFKKFKLVSEIANTSYSGQTIKTFKRKMYTN